MGGFLNAGSSVSIGPFLSFLAAPLSSQIKRARKETPERVRDIIRNIEKHGKLSVFPPLFVYAQSKL